MSAGTAAEAEKLEAALTAVCVGIAKSIAWDGEGATCLIECNVNGANSLDDARLIAVKARVPATGEIEEEAGSGGGARNDFAAPGGFWWAAAGAS